MTPDELRELERSLNAMSHLRKMNRIESATLYMAAKLAGDVAARQEKIESKEVTS